MTLKYQNWSLQLRYITSLLLIVSGLFLSGCENTLPDTPSPTLIPGEIFENQDSYGTYFLYTPTSLSNPSQSLVVVHGTPTQDLTAGETALYYAENWAPFAEEQGWLLLVPAFNQADFSSRKGEITDALASLSIVEGILRRGANL